MSINLTNIKAKYLDIITYVTPSARETILRLRVVNCLEVPISQLLLHDIEHFGTYILVMYFSRSLLGCRNSHQYIIRYLVYRTLKTSRRVLRSYMDHIDSL